MNRDFTLADFYLAVEQISRTGIYHPSRNVPNRVP